MGFWIGFKRAFFARAQFIAQAKPAGEHDAEVGQRRPTRLRWTATGYVSVAESPLSSRSDERNRFGADVAQKKPPTPLPFSQSVILCNRNTTPGPAPLWEQTHRHMREGEPNPGVRERGLSFDL